MLKRQLTFLTREPQSTNGFLLLSLTIMSLMFISAGCSESAPSCSDKSTIEMVLKLSKDELVRTGYPRDQLDKLNLKLSAIRTKKSDEKTGNQECACNLDIAIPTGTFQVPITYTSELTDKRGEFYVTVYGIDEDNIRQTSTQSQDYDSLAKTDIENVRVAMETYFVDNDTFAGASAEKILGNKQIYGLEISPGVKFRVVKSDSANYTVEAFHQRGNKRYVLNGPGGRVMETAK